jgi:antitoxin ParD1/3/4
MSARLTKQIKLTPHLERLIEERVRSGRYESPSEVIREGLRLIEERDAVLSSVRAQVEEGWRASERSETVDGPNTMKQMRSRLIRKLGASRNRKRA